MTHLPLSRSRASDAGHSSYAPFTEVTAAPALPRAGGRVFPLTLTRGPSERTATARLAGVGEVLILYLGNQPQERLVYQAIHRYTVQPTAPRTSVVRMIAASRDTRPAAP